MRVSHASEHERLLDRARALLGAADDAQLAEANVAVNHVLMLRPDCVDGWLLKCQVCSAANDDVSALAAAEMALARAPDRAECLYWCGAVLGDLGRHREALHAIENALLAVTPDDSWLLEDLHYEKVTILASLGLHEAAVASCEAGLKACPGSPLLRAALVPAERARVRSFLKVL